MEIMPVLIVSYILITSIALLNLIWVFTFSVGILINKIIAFLCIAGTFIVSFFVQQVLPPNDLIEWLIILTPSIFCFAFMMLIYRKSEKVNEPQ